MKKNATEIAYKVLIKLGSLSTIITKALASIDKPLFTVTGVEGSDVPIKLSKLHLKAMKSILEKYLDSVYKNSSGTATFSEALAFITNFDNALNDKIPYIKEKFEKKIKEKYDKPTNINYQKFFNHFLDSEITDILKESSKKSFNNMNKKEIKQVDSIY